MPEVAGSVARTGSDKLVLDPMGLNQSDGFLILKPIEQWSVPDKEALIDGVRKVTEAFRGVDIAITPRNEGAQYYRLVVVDRLVCTIG